jgi:hypothetical protein
MTDNAQSRKRRGPKPIGERTMTAAERKRRSRVKQANEGYAEFMVRVSGDTLNFIDLFASSNGVTRTDVVAAFLDLAIKRLGEEMGRALERMKQGDSAEDAMASVRNELTFKPDRDAVRKMMEALY